MSSRLVLLPKKSYCPWKGENVDRVLRDEQQHAEEEAQRKKHEAEAIHAIRHRSHDDDTTKRFSLFDEQQIKEYQEKTQQEIVGESTNAKTKSGARHKNSGPAPIYLGQSAKKNVFYLRPYGDDHQPEDGNNDDDGEPSYEQIKDDRIKSRMDPVQQFMKSDNPPPPRASHPYWTQLRKSEPLSTKDKIRDVRHKSKDGKESSSEKKCSPTEPHRKQKNHNQEAHNQHLHSSSSDADWDSSDDSSSRKHTRRKRRASSSRKHHKSRSRSREDRKKSKRKKRKRTESSDVADPGPSIEELRRRRTAREAKEQQRIGSLRPSNHRARRNNPRR